MDDFKYTGTILFKCDGKGDKDYRLGLVKEKDSMGGGVGVDGCDFLDPNIGHDVDIELWNGDMTVQEEYSMSS